MSDTYRYSDPSVSYLLMISPPWTPTAVTLHPLLSDAAAAARRRFVRQGTGERAAGATIIEVGISENAPWYTPTGRIWWLSSDPCGGVHEVRERKGSHSDHGARTTRKTNDTSFHTET
jgi:hypothetical protein